MLIPRLATPDARPALIVDGRALDGAELAAAASAHLTELEEAGIGRGDRVAVFTQRGLETPVALVAHALAGIVSVPLNPSLGSRELRHILDDARPKRVLAAAPDEVRDRAPDARPIGLGTRPARRFAAEPPVPADPLLLLYTSGTTGAPKGALLTAGNVASNLDALAQAWAWTDRDTVVHALPLFHVHGLVLGLFGSLRTGGALSWVTRFAPDAVAGALAGGTMLFAVPTMYHRLADAAEQDAAVAGALRAARLLVSGSAALPVREHQRIERATGRAVVERYGLTETLINCSTRHDAPRPGYVGPPLAGVELRLVDDARAPLDASDDATLGEVAVRGPNVFAGYLNRDDATAAVHDADGWFYTGDLATRAADGAIRIAGRRATDLIKTGGFKVGAGEVEAAILEHAAVSECAVIGAPDDDLGERIVAFVVVREGAERPAPAALADLVASELAPHKRPRDVRFVDALPRNAMGKVVKAKLGEME